MDDDSPGLEGSDALLTTLAELHTTDRELPRRASGAPPERVSLVPPYDDRGEVARGGMGSVRRAWDGDLGRHVAVKIVAPHLAGDPASVQRFIEEARITGQLDHPNVVPVHRLGDAPDGGPCLVMKLVEGRTFTAYLRALPPPPWPAHTLDGALGVFLKVCDAVAFAHARGVVHRDLKPDNIMVGDFGEVYVMDWGIARALPRPGEPRPPPSAQESARGPMGTPRYMSPEQALRLEHEIDERTDVFLLGAVLYEILTGRAPHRGESLVAVLFSAIAGRVEHPSEAAPERSPPQGLSRIAMRAMARDPRDRYPSALALKRDVEAFIRGEERAPTEVFPPGARVIEEGQEGRAAYVVVSGRCVAFKGDGAARVVLREMGPGDVFGETAVFTARPCTATVEAITELTVKVVTRESLAESLGLHTWMGAFVRSLAERFREVDERLRERELRDARRGGEPGA